MVYALIAAAGKGERFSSVMPKQFFPLGEKTVLETTVSVFENVKQIDKIIVACPEGWEAHTRKLLSGMRKVSVITGGSTRNETVMRGINLIESEILPDEDALVVTHDAARPFVTREIIETSIEKAEIYGAAVAAVPEVDTVIECRDGEFVSAVPERKYMYRAQTPQTFSVLKFKRLYLTLTDEEKEKLTDCSGVFLLRGEKVAIVAGSERNVKITYKGDI